MKTIELTRDEAEYLVDLLEKQIDEKVPASPMFVHRFSPYDIAKDIRLAFGMVTKDEEGKVD